MKRPDRGIGVDAPVLYSWDLACGPWVNHPLCIPVEEGQV